MTSNMIYIVALGVGFKCPRKIHLNTQWGGGVPTVLLDIVVAVIYVDAAKKSHAGIQDSMGSKSVCGF